MILNYSQSLGDVGIQNGTTSKQTAELPPLDLMLEMVTPLQPPKVG